MSWLRRVPLLGLVALALAAVGVYEVTRGGLWHSGHRSLDLLVVLAACAPLLWISRRPLTMHTAFLVVVFTECATFGTPESTMLFLASMVYAAAVTYFGDTRARVVSIALLAALVGTLFWFDPASDTPGNALFFAAVLLVSAGTGWVARNHQQGRITAEHEAEETRAASAVAIAEERGRIARDLHDVVAHGVSLMVVQAAAGRSLLARDPEAARSAFDTIEASGQQALAELRRMLDVMRDSALEPAGRPQPGLSALDGLVDGARAAGNPVTLRVGDRGRVDAGVSVSAYRIVQEALTNAVKHAPGAPVDVVVGTELDELVVDVRNGPSAVPSAGVPGSGYGIPGMRERAALYDGVLEAGPDASGWRVVARLRLEPQRAPVAGR